MFGNPTNQLIIAPSEALFPSRMTRRSQRKLQLADIRPGVMCIEIQAYFVANSNMNMSLPCLLCNQNILVLLSLHVLWYHETSANTGPTLGNTKAYYILFSGHIVQLLDLFSSSKSYILKTKSCKSYATTSSISISLQTRCYSKEYPR